MKQNCPIYNQLTNEWGQLNIRILHQINMLTDFDMKCLYLKYNIYFAR